MNRYPYFIVIGVTMPTWDEKPELLPVSSGTFLLSSAWIFVDMLESVNATTICAS